MSWMSTHFVCCDSAEDAATLANQQQILADIAALKACVDEVILDTEDIQTGVDNLEDGLLGPSMC